MLKLFYKKHGFLSLKAFTLSGNGLFVLFFYAIKLFNL